MSESFEAQIHIYLVQIDRLRRTGTQLRDSLLEEASNELTLAAMRVWQEQCGIVINQLSGGSKAHWLARQFSEAFLMRSASGEAMPGATTEKIVARLLDVLDQARASLSRQDAGPVLSTSPSETAPRRFEFVHDVELRAIVEQAYIDSRHAFEQKEFAVALRTSCGILEAIVTDALQHKGLSSTEVTDAPPGELADWSFETRLAVAEKAGLIRGGCARLPEIARKYRDDVGSASGTAVSERDAQRTAQVLNVVMRDLNPGR